jgi:acyl transferase domain-containing protein/acetylornithine/succinyldiaminopimelate/putrescine aminotransferase/predicted amino acid dehydrogenase/acyl carrier protein
MAEHRVRGAAVLPGAALLELARAAASEACGAAVHTLEAVTFLRPVGPGARLTLDVAVEARSFTVRDGAGEVARGRFVVGAAAEGSAAPPMTGGQLIDPLALYAWYAEQGLSYGPLFRVITTIERSSDAVRARLVAPPDLDVSGLVLHPCLLDGALHALGGLAFGHQAEAGLFLPFAVDRLHLHAPLVGEVVMTGRVRHRGAGMARADVWITDSLGAPLVSIEGVSLKSVSITPARSVVETSPAPVSVPSWRALAPSTGGTSGSWWVIGEAPAGFGATLGARRMTLAEARAQLAVRAPQGLALFAATSASASSEGTAVVDRLGHAVAGLVELFGALPAREPVPEVVVFADEARPEDEALLGVARVLRLEQPGTRARAVRHHHASLAALEAELGADEPEVRVVGASRWAPDEAPLTPGSMPRGRDGPARGAVALITGGLGGLGLATARWLFARHGVRLALLGRAGAPSGSAAEAAVLQLRAEGAQVLAIACDVADRASLSSALDRVRRELGPVALVVHAAGVTSDALMRNKTSASVWSVLRPKVAGVLHLDTLLAADPVAYTVLYASVVGLVGNYGQADYAAANRFLDAWARQRSRPGRRVISVDWGPWAEVGMAVGLADHVRRSGVVPLTTARALEALERILGADVTQAVVLERAASPAEATVSGHGRRSLVPAESSAPAQPQPRSAGGAPAVAPSSRPDAPPRSTSDLERLLLDELSRVLEVDRAELDAETSFRDFGLDSILGAQLVKELERRLGVTVPPSLFFESPDARSLAARLVVLTEGSLAEAPTARPEPVPATPAPVVARAGEAEPIAIIGYALRVPGAADATAFHTLLGAGTSTIREVPAERWLLADHYDPDPEAPGKTYARVGGFVDDIDRFDPLAYGISPREASRMDPVQRMLLDLTREAMEHTGLGPRLHGTDTGVFVGGGASEYGQRFVSAPERIDGHTGTGSASSLLAGRVSHAFDLRGPSFTVDTACSSGLVALHLAMESLRRGECESAVVGASNLLLGAETFVAFSKGRLLSRSGRSRPFAADADGYVRGEAGVTLVLVPLSRAVALGCTVYGLLRGSAVSQDGRTRGLTLPEVQGEVRALSGALRRAGLGPEALRYVEAHAVGSVIGDRTELDAIAQVMEGRPCSIGSHKGVIGHSEVASGLVSIAKLLVSFERGEIPAVQGVSLPAESLARGLEVCGVPMPVGPGFVAAVNAFGFGGTTASVILEAPAATVRVGEHEATPLVLTLSARQPEALASVVAEHLAALPSAPSPADYCHTANTGRAPERLRLAVSAPTRDALVAALSARLRASPLGTVAARPQIAFLFTGQGAQYAGMGRELYDASPVFRDALDRCVGLLDGRLAVPLLEAMFAGTRLDDTALTQLALFALEWATTALWRAAGIEPTMLLGHSVGELVAAAVAGVLSVEDALLLTAARGRLISALPPGGAMLAVAGSSAAVADLIDEVDVSLAAINGPESVVLSGRGEAMTRVEVVLRQRGLRAKRLTVSHAFHSSSMEPMMGELLGVAAGLAHHTPRIPIVSNVDGAWTDHFSAAHWARHVRAPVRFLDGLRTLAGSSPHVLLEVGPDAVLSRLARGALADVGSVVVAASLERGRPARETLLASGAALFESGATPDFAHLELVPRRRVAVPRSVHSPRRTWVDRAPQTEVVDLAPVVRAPASPPAAGPPEEARPARIAGVPARSAVEIEAFLVVELARVLELTPHEVDPLCAIGDLGLDSVVGLEVAARIAAAYAMTSDPELLSPERSIREIAGLILARSGGGAAVDRAGGLEQAPTPPAVAGVLPAVDPADYARYGRPALLARLSAASLDKSFVEARGDRAWFEEDGQRVEVLDMLGGFGSTLFGHNHPELVATAHAILDHGVVHHAQGSTRTAAGTLGRKLSERLEGLTGRPFVSTFLNTGAEAVEAAIKHAQLEYAARADAHARARHKRDACLLHDLGHDWPLPEALRVQLAEHTGQPAPERLGEAIQRLRDAEQAMLEVRPAFIALEKSFHGKTSATSLLTANPGYRSRYTEGIRVLRGGTTEELARHVTAESRALLWLEQDGGSVVLERAPWASIAAAFVEPVQGEGGVRPLGTELLAELRRLADAYGFPVVADEVQAGFGRCGAFSAAAALGLSADYYTFGKSLGGGLCKISVLCVAADRHQPDFDLFHTSTFAEDDPSALLGLRALEIYDRDGLEARARAMGGRLMAALSVVQRRHPTVFREVRGMGLLVGIELCDMSASPSAFIRLTEENLGNLASAWFLHVERIRFLPTSSATHTLRLEPSAYISEADVDRVVAAFGRFALVMERGNVAHLLAPLVGEVPPTAVRDWSGERQPERITAVEGERRVAFVTYFVEPEDLVRWAPAMGELTSKARDLLLERLHRVIAPRVFRSAHIESASGERVLFDVYGLMSTSAMIEQAMGAGDLDWIRAQIDEAVDMAIASGARVVGFGGLSSVVTRNCRLAATDRVALTTGNALTVAMGVEGLRRAAARSGIDVTRARLGVVGAAGNIGETYARVIAESSERLLLVGRPGGRARLEAVADRLYDDASEAALLGAEQGLARIVRGTRAFAEGCRGSAMRIAIAKELGVPPVLISERMEDLRSCPLILSASNSARAIIHPEHVGTGPVVICDVAVPPDVAPAAREMPGVRVVTGGAVRLPRQRELDLCMGHLPRGHVYACMAETLLLGLEGRGRAAGHFSFGPIERDRVREIWALAQKHGFGLEREDEPAERSALGLGSFDVARLN